jgi:uncharacterized membrane protein YeaQ/YmgE (transglycosylase-associated protein family)
MDKEEINKRIKWLTEEQSSINTQYSWVENIERESIKKMESSNSLILGLAVGIVGNFFAQFAYSSIESVSSSNLNLFYVSITGLVITLIILILIINHYFKLRKREQQYIENNLEKGKSALRIRNAMIPYEIEELKKQLESIHNYHEERH